MRMVGQHKVLLVDDSDLALSTVSCVLEDAGYEVRSTNDVATLRRRARRLAPDIILTDVNMPGISGVDLCRMLKSSYDTAHVPGRAVLRRAQRRARRHGRARARPMASSRSRRPDRAADEPAADRIRAVLITARSRGTSTRRRHAPRSPRDR